MKKRIVSFLIAVFCLIPFVLTGCSSGEDGGTVITTKPYTINLYGITGESTTEDAILAVQNELNKYTEGNFGTRVILHLYTEDEYYKVIDEKFESLQNVKPTVSDSETTDTASTAAPETTGGTETGSENSGSTDTAYPAEKDTQLDIFMVQGKKNLNKYIDGQKLTSLTTVLNDSEKIVNKYINKIILTNAISGGKTDSANGVFTGGSLYGIPNNYVFGEYTYLLVNKEIAEQYGYAEEDVSTLGGLRNFLDDAAKDHKDHITLYNEPVLNKISFGPDIPLIGSMLHNKVNTFTSLAPNLLTENKEYIEYWELMNDATKGNYVVEGDQYALPEDKKVAAAFLKGDSTLPEDYKDDYHVITYMKPVATDEERPGTMFCVSKYTVSVQRCMQVIAALQTVASFRNTFQYGVEGVNYEVDDTTGLVNYLNEDYMMDEADTGNLFLLTPNNRMDAKMLKLAENNWELGKAQLRDTINTPYCNIPFAYVTRDNFRTESVLYTTRYNNALHYHVNHGGTYEDFVFDEEGLLNDEKNPFTYNSEYIAELQTVCEGYVEKLKNFDGKDDEGNDVTMAEYLKMIGEQIRQTEAYESYTQLGNMDAPLAQFTNWYLKNAFAT